MPTPTTNAAKYRTFGESRVDYYDTFYQEAYARAFAANEDAQAAHKAALQATQREMLQAQRDMADLNESMLKTSAGGSRANLDRAALLSNALRAAENITRTKVGSAERQQKQEQMVRESYTPDETVGLAAERWATDAAAANADGNATNQSKLGSFVEEMKKAAPSIRNTSPSKARANSRKYVDAGMKAGLTEEQAIQAVSNATQVPGAQLTRESIDADRNAELADTGKYNIAAEKDTYKVLQISMDALSETGAGDEAKDNATALANLYLSGAKTVQTPDGYDLNDKDERVPKFKTEVVDDDTYARMQQALADGEFNQKDMDTLGLTPEDYQTHLTVGRIVETLPAKFSATDRGNFSGAKMELLKKQAALSGQLKDLQSNVPKMKSEEEIRAESVARAEPYQKVAPGEGLRLALGIQSRPLRQMDREAAFAQQNSATGSGPLSTLRNSLRPAPAQAPAPMPELDDEQKLLVGGSRIAQSAGYKPTDDEDRFAKAIAARRASGAYQKGELVRMAVQNATGANGVVDTTKRDRLLAAYAHEFALGKKGTKPAEASAPKEAKPAEAKNTPEAAGDKPTKMGQQDAATLAILKKQLSALDTKIAGQKDQIITPAQARQYNRNVAEQKRIIGDNEKWNARVFEPSPAGVVNDQSRFMMGGEPMAGGPFVGSPRLGALLKKVLNPTIKRSGSKDEVRPTPPIEAEDPTFNDDIQNLEEIPSFEKMKAEDPNLRQDEYDEYIQRTYRSK